MRNYIDFEKPIEEIERKIDELKQLKGYGDKKVIEEIEVLEKEAKERSRQIIENLTPWQQCLLARHPDRPYTLDYIKAITEEFIELHGDRRFSDDPAIVGGLCRIDGIPAMLIGHQKGRGTKERIQRNFGQPHPEGYRKALRIMKLAERFHIPIVTLIDTPGAFPGVGSEERGQSEAIATNLMEMSLLKTPIVSIVIGEGGSGGALALTVADRLFMLQYSIYSVISPEGCAAILLKNDKPLTQEDFAKAANSLKLTAQHLQNYGITDDIIEEPQGGAHRNVEETARNIKRFILSSFEELHGIDPFVLVEKRYKKLRAIGVFLE
ncbi:MAG: acetyl-CoA carboxylase carboxyltransferase subunit alpha [Candidatus Magnetoovum sp. WYHC-5]|nr:acetyl-CoA carboxylase carboxyltransferase subunit alpha [Candidatus Magnetoovum sp. WYHC-5]